VPECFEATNGEPVLKLQIVGEWISAVPVVENGSKPWFMFGGNFIHSCDSRFAALNGGHPIAVHDRTE